MPNPLYSAGLAGRMRATRLRPSSGLTLRPVDLPRTSRDPRGREILLTPERWKHIIDGHPELEAYGEDILRAVEAPTEIGPGREADEEWFYLMDAGPSRWLKIVVVFESAASDRIITAFPRRRKP